ncbi:MAG TPA: zinc ribbon domain-containing protein [Acidobacteriaceae bacterium]
MQSFLQFLHSVMNQLQPAIQWVHDTVLSLLASPERWIVYVAAGWIALLLIAFPLFRYSGRRRRRSEPFEEVRSYSVLGIGPAARAQGADMDDVIRPERTYSRWADASPLIERPVAQPASNVRPIRPSRTVKCTHCGGPLSSGQNFCPACGYAQPLDHRVTA